MGTSTYTHTTGTNTIPKLPIDKRHWPIDFESHDGTTGCRCYPINYDELYYLKGRLLTLVDAMVSDTTQRKAFKDLVWTTLRTWMNDIESAGPAPTDPMD